MQNLDNQNTLKGQAPRAIITFDLSYNPVGLLIMASNDAEETGVLDALMERGIGTPLTTAEEQPFITSQGSRK